MPALDTSNIEVASAYGSNPAIGIATEFDLIPVNSPDTWFIGKLSLYSASANLPTVTIKAYMSDGNSYEIFTATLASAVTTIGEINQYLVNPIRLTLSISATAYPTALKFYIGLLKHC